MLIRKLWQGIRNKNIYFLVELRVYLPENWIINIKFYRNLVVCKLESWVYKGKWKCLRIHILDYFLFWPALNTVLLFNRSVTTLKSDLKIFESLRIKVALNLNMLIHKASSLIKSSCFYFFFIVIIKVFHSTFHNFLVIVILGSNNFSLRILFVKILNLFYVENAKFRLNPVSSQIQGKIKAGFKRIEAWICV